METSLRDGLSFLGDRQLPSGGFASSMAVSYNCVNDEMNDFHVEGGKAFVEADQHSVFPSILTGLCLLPAKGLHLTDGILCRLADFVVANRYSHGFWQHFTSQHLLYQVNPCDMDDTSMASLFLKEMKVKTSVNLHAILCNKTRDGLFYTWFALRQEFNLSPSYWIYVLRELKERSKMKDFWKKKECDPYDVDAVVNANVLTYVGLSKKTMPVVEWINRILSDETETTCDKWYRSLSTVHYFFSRIYRSNDVRLEQTRKLIRERVSGRFSPSGSVENHPMDTALAVSTLLNIDCAEDIPQAAIGYLTGSQRPDGSWPRKIVYYGGPKKVVGWGSEEMTTAFCIEAICRYSKQMNFGIETTTTYPR